MDVLETVILPSVVAVKTRVYDPDLEKARFVKVATPAYMYACVVPDSCEELTVMAWVVPLTPYALFFWESRSSMTGCVDNGVPAAPVALGCVRSSSSVGVECTKNGLDVVKMLPDSNLSS